MRHLYHKDKINIDAKHKQQHKASIDFFDYVYIACYYNIGVNVVRV